MSKFAAALQILVLVAGVGVSAHRAYAQAGGATSQPTASRAAESKSGARCAVCSDATTIVCPGCVGKGRCMVECALCGGVGKRACWWCVDAPKFVPTGHAALKKGFVPCLNTYCDGKGFTHWEGSSSPEPCRYCSAKGSFKCLICEGGAANCYWCGGSGRDDRTCPDCGGSGKLACPGCAVDTSSFKCPWSRDSNGLWCHLCTDGRGEKRPIAASTGTIRCGECAGRGWNPCKPCNGVGRADCAECRLTGYLWAQPEDTGTKAGRKMHEACKGNGWTPCDKCTNGRAPCLGCIKGRLAVKCTGCGEHNSVTCRGCTPGAWQAFETYGRYLAGAGFNEQAATFFRAADVRATALTVEPAEGNEATKGKMLDLAKATRARLAASLKAIADKKPLPPPGKTLY